jgi:hypothetical protein
MKRLVELGDDAGANQKLALLVNSSLQGRAEFGEQELFRKRRVRTRLLRAGQKARRLSPSLVLALLACGAAASAAAQWASRSELEPAPAPAGPAEPAPVRAATKPAAAPSRKMLREPEPSPAPAPRREARHLPASVRREAEDPRRVMEAMRALRQDKDPARAQVLLAEHQLRHPRSALSEEVLALSIEAAVARKDSAAKEHARRYLAQYPRGRFRELAVRALSR